MPDSISARHRSDSRCPVSFASAAPSRDETGSAARTGSQTPKCLSVCPESKRIRLAYAADASLARYKSWPVSEIVSSTVKNSANRVSNSARLPQSALIAATRAPRFSVSSRWRDFNRPGARHSSAPAWPNRLLTGCQSTTGIR